MNSRIMIAVFNHHASRFLGGATATEVNEVASMVCPETRSPGRTLRSDAPSRDREGAVPDRNRQHTGSSHTYEPHTTLRDKYEQEFSRQIATWLDDARKRNEFGHLVMVAPPDMLGAVRAGLSKECRRMVAAEHHKNLAHLDVGDIVNLLPHEVQLLGKTQLGVAGVSK